MHLRKSNWLGFGFIAFITAIFLLLGIAVTAYLRQQHEQQATAQLRRQVTLASNFVAQTLSGSHADLTTVAQQISTSTGTGVTIIAPDGSVLGASDAQSSGLANQAENPEVASAVSGNTVVLERTVTASGPRTWFAAAPVRTESGVGAVVRLAETSEQIDSGYAAQRNAIALMLLVAEIGVLVSAMMFARLATRPLDKIVAMTRRVSHGDLSARAPVEQGSEFTEVAVAFNEMADELESTFEAIDVERKRLESVVEHLADGIVIVDAEDRVVLMNVAAEKLLGLRRARSISRTYAEVLRDYELAAVVREGHSVPEAGAAPRTTIVEMGMPRRWVQAFSYPIPSEVAPLILVVLRDVTEFRRTEAVRRDFVANVSHDLRTPIASLKALVETLLDGALEDPSVAREFLSRMEIEVDDLVRLVEELLQLSRAEAGQIELRIVASNVGEVIRRVAERLRAQASLKEIEIRVDVPMDLPLAEFDPERVEQVLVNLVHNAIKFTPWRGVTAITATSSEREIVVAVADSGQGLDPRDVERVFERFYKADRSRAAAGSGLGLAIAKHMIQLHGGRIWVENDFGRGATFKFSLPRAQ
ncbi:MAG TPA: ATP-binding protein [Nitrolancea sp.]|nr:ATP-binding protein [Nitrolancea sp.]